MLVQEQGRRIRKIEGRQAPGGRGVSVVVVLEGEETRVLDGVVRPEHALEVCRPRREDEVLHRLAVHAELEVSLEVRAGEHLVSSPAVQPDRGNVEIMHVRVELESRALRGKAAGHGADCLQPRDVVELGVQPDHVASRAHVVEVGEKRHGESVDRGKEGPDAEVDDLAAHGNVRERGEHGKVELAKLHGHRGGARPGWMPRRGPWLRPGWPRGVHRRRSRP